MKEIFPGVWKDGKRLLTLNLVNGKNYSEELVKDGKKEYRVWDPNRSKPAAAILKGLKLFPVKPGSSVLYLGIASGQTASYFSDIIGENGVIYGVEISERSVRDLNPIAERRGNIVPILSNAKTPGEYSWIEKVDVVFQDVASDDQSEVFIRNCKEFLKPSGIGMLSIKARSIDVTKEPKEIYKKELVKLEEHFEVLEKLELDPFEKDHMFVVVRWKS